VVLGVLISRQGRLPGLPRFAGLHLHRFVSLLAVAFVAVHILAAVADSYVSISLAAAIIPFASAYKPLWLGLGAICIDLLAAIIVTSLLRHRIGRRPGAPCTGWLTCAGRSRWRIASARARICAAGRCSASPSPARWSSAPRLAGGWRVRRTRCRGLAGSRS